METFPDLPMARLIRTPVFITSVIRYGNKKEQRLRRDPSPRHRLRLEAPQATDLQKQAVQDFFIARKGRWEAFFFTDPDPESATYGQDLTVRFEQDQTNFEYFSYLWWKLGRIELIEE